MFLRPEKVIVEVEHQFVLINLLSTEQNHTVELSNKFNINENEDYVFGYGDSRFKKFQVILDFD